MPPCVKVPLCDFAIVGSGRGSLKTATAFRAWSIFTWQVAAVPLHVPLQPWNVAAWPAVAVSVTIVPAT